MQRAKFLHRDDYQALLPEANKENPYTKDSITAVMSLPQYKWVNKAVVVRAGLMLFSSHEEYIDWLSCQGVDGVTVRIHSMAHGNSTFGSWIQGRRHAT